MGFRDPAKQYAKHRAKFRAKDGPVTNNHLTSIKIREDFRQKLYFGGKIFLTMAINGLLNYCLFVSTGRNLRPDNPASALREAGGFFLLAGMLSKIF
jgi:hypothetical protein